ncbi:hypothetical protein COLO4_10143 [Corchorus olitorius]|uniref:Retrotransposon gag protein n=1 Tax=Corchorus olitorius TaxID=93759 RepID=A0A1R3K9W3_9ROSI|nr:hypothetical protein COLO4_10143 [Corchorus olitorius]
MPPKNDTTALADAIAGLTESLNAQLQELRLSQDKLAIKVDHSIVENQTSIQTLQAKLANLENPASPLLPHSNPSAALFKLKQRGTVTEYQQEYEILANQVKGLSNEHLLHCFISGLHPEIQHEVIPLTPTNLTHALALAKMIEAKLTAQRAIRRAHPGQVFGGISKPMQNTSSAYKAPGLPTSPRLPALPAPQIKQLTPTEMQARRAKGLCYNCDEKYVSGHKCRTVPFLLLQAENEDEPGELFVIQADNPPELSPLSSLPLPPPPQNYTTQTQRTSKSLIMPSMAIHPIDA